MSLGNWLHYLATGGLLVVLLPCLALGQVQEKPEEPAAKTQAKDEFDSVSNDSLRAIFEDVVKLYAREKSEGAAAEQRKERRDDATLVAQQDAAYWAAMAAFVAAVALGANAITIGLVWLTFRETRRTADAAVAAAVAAEDAVFEDEAPFLYPEIVYATIGRELTPFRVQDHPSSPHGPVVPKVGFKIKNFGQSPAVLRSWSAELRVYERIPTELETVVAYPSPVAIIEPGVSTGTRTGTIADEFVVQVAPPMTRETAHRVTEGHAHIVLFGDCRFAGTHGANYTQTFGLRYSWASHHWFPLGAEHNKRDRDRPGKPKPKESRWQFWK